LARCDSYGSELVSTLAKMFDQLGGLGRLVKGKTVAIKLNLTGNPDSRLGYLPIELTTWTHPAVIGAAVHLIGQAGAATCSERTISTIPTGTATFSSRLER
jgi:uncharacterized protein (DUF362 family)